MEFLDVELFNQKDLFKLFIRFLIDFSFTFVIIRVLYFAANRRKDIYLPSSSLTYLPSSSASYSEKYRWNLALLLVCLQYLVF